MAFKQYNEVTKQWDYLTPTKAEHDNHVVKVATAAELGHVMVDGVTITVDSTGKISAVGAGGGEAAVDATTLVKGIVQLSNEINTDSELFAATPKAVKDALEAAKAFTTTSVADLIGSAPETLNTLQELATAVQESDTALDGLLTTVGAKANTADLTAHVNDTTAHITAAERTQWNNGSKIHFGSEAPADTGLIWVSPIV